MASPKLEVVTFYDNTGAPLTGLTPTFTTYVDDGGSTVSQPSISAIAGGGYKFTPAFADPAKGIFYVLDGGATAYPRYYSRYMRAEDWYADGIPDLQVDTTRLRKYNENRKQIVTTGTDANREIVYDDDDVTALQKFDLYDRTGSPSSVNPTYDKVPV